jgi:hypothetical protein
MTAPATRRLVQQLLNYDLPALSEDILKTVYQELVDPATRRDLSEFYIPDWPAERMLRQTLTSNPKQTVLDPACGSGTFLYTAARRKRQALGNSPATLDHIVQTITGIDVHPLAAIVPGTNFLLGLRDLLKKTWPARPTLGSCNHRLSTGTMSHLLVCWLYCSCTTPIWKVTRAPIGS